MHGFALRPSLVSRSLDHRDAKQFLEIGDPGGLGRMALILPSLTCSWERMPAKCCRLYSELHQPRVTASTCGGRVPCRPIVVVPLVRLVSARGYLTEDYSSGLLDFVCLIRDPDAHDLARSAAPGGLGLGRLKAFTSMWRSGVSPLPRHSPRRLFPRGEDGRFHWPAVLKGRAIYEQAA
jgi:hypothetical protein